MHFMVPVSHTSLCFKILQKVIFPQKAAHFPTLAVLWRPNSGQEHLPGGVFVYSLCVLVFFFSLLHTGIDAPTRNYILELELTQFKS